jgi:hypothetical protein
MKKEYIILQIFFFIFFTNFKTLYSQNITEYYFNRFYSICFYDNHQYKIIIGGIGQKGCEDSEIVSFGTYKKRLCNYYLTSSSTINPDSIGIIISENEDKSLMDSFKICIDSPYETEINSLNSKSKIEKIYEYSLTIVFVKNGIQIDTIKYTTQDPVFSGIKKSNCLMKMINVQISLKNNEYDFVSEINPIKYSYNIINQNSNSFNISIMNMDCYYFMYKRFNNLKIRKIYNGIIFNNSKLKKIKNYSST